jgi:hypothetical protein
MTPIAFPGLATWIPSDLPSGAAFYPPNLNDCTSKVCHLGSISSKKRHSTNEAVHFLLLVETLGISRHHFRRIFTPSPVDRDKIPLPLHGDVAIMSKSIYDIDQAGNVLCTYTDADKENLKIVRYIPSSQIAPGARTLLGSRVQLLLALRSCAFGSRCSQLRFCCQPMRSIGS